MSKLYSWVLFIVLVSIPSFSMQNSVLKPKEPFFCSKAFASKKGVNLYDLQNNKDIFFQYEYEEPGFRISIEIGPPVDNLQFSELRYFALSYDPIKIKRGSFFKRVLGLKPMQYASEDIVFFTPNSVYLSEGPVLQFFLRHPEDKYKLKDLGPLLAIALKSGKIIGYPGSTDVDFEITGILRGSALSVYRFLKGLTIEAHNSIKNPKGNWYITTDSIVDR